MTCIVGVQHRGVVYLGGDSAGVGGWNLCVRADAKVFRNGPCVIGMTTSFRLGNLLAFAFKPPIPPRRGPLLPFMATTFIDAIRNSLKAGGYAKKEHEHESGGTFLVGVRGRLFEISDDYQVGVPLDGYASVGCGGNQALGALYATARGPLMGQPRDRILLALRAAERFSAGVRRPFRIVSTEAE